MITFTHGNLLDAKVDALVNTVNTVGVMGKGIALMFKERFPENYRAYAAACKRHELEPGQLFVTERQNWVGGARWIINFPTKKHWRHKSKMEWIDRGLDELRDFIGRESIRSIAIPPLGSGNGGLVWSDVKSLIVRKLESLSQVLILVYEPTEVYQNVSKREGVEKLTPARALVADLVRRYSVLGSDCTILEIHKLAYFLERRIVDRRIDNPLRLRFHAHRFGPYAPKLSHLLNGLDGSYLHCEKRVADAGILDTIWFEDDRRDSVALYLSTEAREYLGALNEIAELIDGFESPHGMELLATVDWLVFYEGVEPEVDSVRAGLRRWLGGGPDAQRKDRIFKDRSIDIALGRLQMIETTE